jgi:hypothetical protein
LLSAYTADLGLRSDAGEFLLTAAQDVVRPDHWEEMESLAHELAVPVGELALSNFYYDAMKIVLGRVFGCTAFAVDAPGGVLHARNLDWWTVNSTLARYTTVNRFVGGQAGSFATIGWPGFVGAFSRIAPGRLAVTLNAVLSLEASSDPDVQMNMTVQQMVFCAATGQYWTRLPVPTEERQ